MTQLTVVVVNSKIPQSQRKIKKGGADEGGGRPTRPQRCMLERCISGMKRTGLVTWSSRVLKKVLSLPMELDTTDLMAKEGEENTGLD
jgi:hypothetical protein